jgi:lipoprotein NlpI
MEFRRGVWYSSKWTLLCESYVMSFKLSLFKNVKHCVVNSLGIYITMTGKYLTEYLQCNAILYIQNLYAQNTKRGPLLHTTPHPFFSHQQPSVITPYSV